MLSRISPEVDHRLRLLKLRLERAVLERKLEGGHGNGGRDGFSGLYVTEAEVQGLFSSAGHPDGPKPDALKAVDERLRAAREDLRRMRRESSLFELLRYNFGFDETEAYLCLFACAPDLDPAFGKILAYLQDSLQSKRPTCLLAAECFLGKSFDLGELRRMLGPRGSLVRSRLVALEGKGPGEAAPFFARQLVPCPSLLDFWTDLPGVGDEVERYCRLDLPGGARFEGLFYRQHAGWVEDQLRLDRSVPTEPGARDCSGSLLLGEAGWQMEKAVHELARRMNRRVLTVDMKRFWPEIPADFARIWELIERETRLWSAVLLADFLRIEGEGSVAALIERLPDSLFRNPLIRFHAIARRESRGAWESLPHRFRIAAFAPAARGERKEIWEGLWSLRAGGDLGESAGALATHFGLTPDEIEDIIVRSAWMSEGQPRRDSLMGLCRDLKANHVDRLVKRLRRVYVWEDLVVPPDVLEQLQEICAAAKWTSRVYDAWGFENKLSLGKGLSVLFSGASGTGKTMCAEIIANSLELDLYKIDLSSIVSKYIGETEKNLSRIFDEIEHCNGILLFDEADALFGKRSEVKDAHDRYANIEIDHLLQKLEEYQGMVILTTNLLQNLDSAFTRRFKYIVDFPLPDEALRERIWQQVFPAAAPRSERIDFGFLSRKFQLTGANIKNVAVNAAFLAASNGGVIDMPHIIKAIKREFQKMGKLPNRSDFGPYYEWIREAKVG